MNEKQLAALNAYHSKCDATIKVYEVLQESLCGQIETLNDQVRLTNELLRQANNVLAQLISWREEAERMLGMDDQAEEYQAGDNFE